MYKMTNPRSGQCLFVAPHRVLLRAAELNKCSRSETVRCVGARARARAAAREQPGVASDGAPGPPLRRGRSMNTVRLFIGTCSCSSTTRWSTRRSRSAAASTSCTSGTTRARNKRIARISAHERTLAALVRVRQV